MQIKGRDYQVLYTKESKEVQVAIDLLSMVEHKSLTVEYKERKAFLTPFIPLLINPQKEHGLKGVSNMPQNSSSAASQSTLPQVA